MGEAFIFLGEQESLTYAWGIGRATNNEAESLALSKVLNIATQSSWRNLYVIEDSIWVINKLCKIGQGISKNHNSLWRRIQMVA